MTQEFDSGDTGIGTTRRIDQLGRVVVPAELRKLLGMQEGDIVSFSAQGADLVLRRVAPNCAICGERDRRPRRSARQAPLPQLRAGDPAPTGLTFESLRYFAASAGVHGRRVRSATTSTGSVNGER